MAASQDSSIPIAPAVLALALTVVLAMPGCGGDPEPVTDRDATLQLKLREFRIEPQVIRVRPGRIHIVARNVGTLAHNLKVRSLNRKRGEEVKVYGEAQGTAFPRGTIVGDVTLPPGKFELVCTIGNHDDLGQTGTLIVGDGN